MGASRQAIFFTVFNWQASEWVGLQSPMVPFNASGHSMRHSFEGGEDSSQEIFILSGLVITTAWILHDLRLEARQLGHSGWIRYSMSIYNWFDLTRILTQLAINVVILLLEVESPVSAGCIGAQTCALKEMLYVLQAILMISLYFGMLYYFRGFLRFAVLVHVLYSIITDIMPFLMLLTTLWIGFALALWLLLQYVVRVIDSDLQFAAMKSWSAGAWIYHSLNMGLFGHLDDGSLELIHHAISIQVRFLPASIALDLLLSPRSSYTPPSRWCMSSTC